MLEQYNLPKINKGILTAQQMRERSLNSTKVLVKASTNNLINSIYNSILQEVEDTGATTINVSYKDYKHADIKTVIDMFVQREYIVTNNPDTKTITISW